MTRMEAEKDLHRRGFRQLTKAAKCAACKRDFEWWISPRRKLIPLNAVNLEPHWLICSKAFRNHKPPTKQEPYFRGRYGDR
jgi:hypothetical protein